MVDKVRRGVQIDENGYLRISGIMSSGGFESYANYKADYDEDIDIVDGTVTLTATFDIKYVIFANTGETQLILSFGQNAAAGKQVLIPAGASFEAAFGATDVRVKTLADNGSYAYTLLG